MRDERAPARPGDLVDGECCVGAIRGNARAGRIVRVLHEQLSRPVAVRRLRRPEAVVVGSASGRSDASVGGAVFRLVAISRWGDARVHSLVVLALAFSVGCGAVLGIDDIPQPTDAGSGADGNAPGGDGGEAGAPGTPAHPPSAVAFRDQDPRAGISVGTVTIGKAVDETDVTSYALYWGIGGARGPKITTLDKTGGDLTYALSSFQVPSGATQLLAFSANRVGEMATGVSTEPADNFPVYADISAMQGDGSGTEASVVIDATNGKLLVAANDYPNSQKPALFRCNLDGSGCGYTDISAGQGAQSGLSPSVVVDTRNEKLLVATYDYGSSGRPALFRCNLDGTGCSHFDISAGIPCSPACGVNPSAVIDTKNDKLLVVTSNQANAFKPALFRCNLDGTACTYADISAGQGASSGNVPVALVDSKNDALLVVTENQANASRLALFRCKLDGTACTYADISAGQAAQSGHEPAAVVDALDGKLLVVTDDYANSQKPALFRCNLDGSGCTYADLSAGQGQGSGAGPAVALDASRGKLLAVTRATRPSLFSIGLW